MRRSWWLALVFAAGCAGRGVWECGCESAYEAGEAWVVTSMEYTICGKGEDADAEVEAAADQCWDDLDDEYTGEATCVCDCVRTSDLCM
jgi:hypothetical protein